MKSVSILELRQHAKAIIAQVQRGQRLVLTYRGRPMARLEPYEDTVAADDSFYRLTTLATSDGPAPSLTNRDIDETLYGR